MARAAVDTEDADHDQALEFDTLAGFFLVRALMHLPPTENRTTTKQS